ncbi:MAG TPA: hypothetical protein VJ840_00145 [Gemmatimonadaceae bacterium]|nr:hypothetical protein [Gemmatimonadaceae bacterium]
MKRLFAASFIVVACTKSQSDQASTASSTSTGSDSARPIATPSGFSQPEAVRYDPDQDVYFVSNFGPGDAQATDNNGYISRMTPDGKVDQAQFIAGGKNGVMLHAPRGMYIVGDTLWVADEDALRGFNRRTGAPLATADFSKYKRGFLNDVAAGPDGEYLTDTGTNIIYRISNGRITVALQDKALGGPNGITWDASRRRFIVVPYGTDSVIRAWTPGSKTLTVIGKGGSTKYDGVEVLSGGSVIASAQGDSSLYLFSDSTGRAIIKTGGAPADIAVDTKRNRVAVPFVDRNVVEIWELPSR